MSRKGGNPDFGKTVGFKKGDPRINRKGAPKKLPVLKELMAQLLGHAEDEDMTQSELAKMVSSAIETAKARSNPNQINALKEILERTFGKVKAEDQNTNVNITWVENKTYEDGKDKKKKD